MLKIPEYFKIEINIDMTDTYNNIDITSLFDVSKQITDLIRQNYLKENMPSQGKLVNFTWTVEYENNLYQLQLKLPPEWYWVEFGRRPGPVGRKGLENIMRWMEVKGMIQRGSYNKIPSKVWAVAKKIEKKGFYGRNGEHQGKHIIEKSLKEADPLISQLCNMITEKLNSKVRQDVVTVFEGLNNFKTK